MHGPSLWGLYRHVCIWDNARELELMVVAGASEEGVQRAATTGGGTACGGERCEREGRMVGKGCR